MRAKPRRLRSEIALSAVALGFAACGGRETPSEIEIDRDAQGRPLAVRLLRAIPSRETPIDLLKVYLVPKTGAATALPPLVGSYSFEGKDLRFEPRFPFEPGQRYRAVTASGLEQPFASEAEETPLSPATRIAEVFPSGDEWPENVLRVYLHFSAPMSIGRAAQHVRWLDAKGRTVPYAFLEIVDELWDRDGERLTLLFDPGRVKRGLVPNEELGRALRAGERYELQVDASWPDAQGRPLAGELRRIVRAVSEDLASPSLDAWELTPPRAGTREPLRLAFGEALDERLAREWIWVEDEDGKRLEGAIELGAGERSWSFTPSAPWSSSPHRLAANAGLEDVCGNSLRAPFEVDLFETVRPPAGDTRTRVFSPLGTTSR